MANPYKRVFHFVSNNIMKENKTESEIALKIKDYIEHCAKNDLIKLYNFIFSEQISDIEDIDWGN